MGNKWKNRVIGFLSWCYAFAIGFLVVGGMMPIFFLLDEQESATGLWWPLTMAGSMFWVFLMTTTFLITTIGVREILTRFPFIPEPWRGRGVVEET